MTLIQPQENVALPEEVSRQVEAAKNQITVNQIETKRLGGIVSSLKYEISQLTLEKTTLDTSIETNKSQWDSIMKDIVAKTAIRDVLVAEIIEKEKTIQNQARDISKRATDIENKEKDIIEKETELNKKVAVFENDKKLFVEMEKDHKDRFQKITDALK